MGLSLPPPSPDQPAARVETAGAIDFYFFCQNENGLGRAREAELPPQIPDQPDALRQMQEVLVIFCKF